MSDLGLHSHVLPLRANNFSVLRLLGAESLGSVAESQDMWWGKPQPWHCPMPSVPLPVSQFVSKMGMELPNLPEVRQGLTS